MEIGAKKPMVYGDKPFFVIDACTAQHRPDQGQAKLV
jgi:hypothetical protein